MAEKYDHIRVRKIVQKAEGYLELDMPEYALAEIRKASRMSVQCSPDLFYLEGAALHKIKRYRDALYPLGQAVLLEPANLKTWLLIGNCQKRIGRCDLAIESLENALSIQPNSPVALYNLACYHALAKHPEECLRYLSQAISLSPRYREYARNEQGFQILLDNPKFTELLREPTTETSEQNASATQ